jgi:hypothetical protein
VSRICFLKRRAPLANAIPASVTPYVGTGAARPP